MSVGKTIDASVIQKGLLELNGDLRFDVATKRGAWHPNQALRQGVFWHETHICAMDRGLVPEFKQWSVVTRLVEVDWAQADKDDVSIQTRTIRKADPDYVPALLHVWAKDLGWELRPDGVIMQLTPVAPRKMQGRVVMVGWRHTFERIINRNLPGLTRSAIAAKFGVDMMKFPIGAPHELRAALVDE